MKLRLKRQGVYVEQDFGQRTPFVDPECGVTLHLLREEGNFFPMDIFSLTSRHAHLTKTTLLIQGEANPKLTTVLNCAIKRA